MGPYHKLVHKNEVKTRNKRYASFILKCIECKVLFSFYSWRRKDFHWNIGRTEGEIQTEGQENAGPIWALLGLGRTLGSAGPGVALLALSFLCVVRLDVVCCLLLPHTELVPAILFKNTWKQNKTLPV